MTLSHAEGAARAHATAPSPCASEGVAQRAPSACGSSAERCFDDAHLPPCDQTRAAARPAAPRPRSRRERAVPSSIVARPRAWWRQIWRARAARPHERPDGCGSMAARRRAGGRWREEEANDSRALDARGRVCVGLRLRAEQHRRAGAVAAAAERRRGGLVRLCEPLRRAVEARGGRLRRGVRAERQRQRRVVGVAAAAACELDGSRALAGPRRLRCGGRRDIVCVGRTERGYETRGERRVRVVRARRVSI